MATTRARKGDARTLSASEQRWLLDQMVRRSTPTPSASESAVGSEEASSMIERPGAVTPVPPAAPATGATPGDAVSETSGGTTAPGDLVTTTGTPVPVAERLRARTSPVRRPSRLAERATTVKAASPESASLNPQYSTMAAHRAAPVVELTRYRAVFACCMQARDAPTEQSPSE